MVSWQASGFSNTLLFWESIGIPSGFMVVFVFFLLLLLLHAFDSCDQIDRPVVLSPFRPSFCGYGRYGVEQGRSVELPG